MAKAKAGNASAAVMLLPGRLKQCVRLEIAHLSPEKQACCLLSDVFESHMQCAKQGCLLQLHSAASIMHDYSAGYTDFLQSTSNGVNIVT